MATYCYSSVVSDHIVRDNAGFLICLAAPICRSGWQSYRRSELDPSSGDDSLVDVYRPVEEVTAKAAIASAEGKPVVGIGHPPEFVNPANATWVSKGHIQNIRVGKPDKNGDIPLLADLHVHDESLIYQIQNGVRELSCGYEYELEEGPKPGTFIMRNLRMNHCAVVPNGRAGNARIIDAVAPESFETITARYLGRNPEEVQRERSTTHRAVDQRIEYEEPVMTKKRSNDADDRDATLDRIASLLERLLARLDSKEAEDEDTLYRNGAKDEKYNARLVSETEELPQGDRPRNPVRAADATDVMSSLADNFDALARSYLGQPIVIGRKREVHPQNRRAVDRRSASLSAAEAAAQDFEKSVNAMREIMLRGGSYG